MNDYENENEFIKCSIEFLINNNNKGRTLKINNKPKDKVCIKDKKFYRKRIMNITKELLDGKYINDDIENVFYHYIYTIINYFKITDKNDILQNEYILFTDIKQQEKEKEKEKDNIKQEEEEEKEEDNIKQEQEEKEDNIKQEQEEKEKNNIKQEQEEKEDNIKQEQEEKEDNIKQEQEEKEDIEEDKKIMYNINYNILKKKEKYSLDNFLNLNKVEPLILFPKKRKVNIKDKKLKLKDIIIKNNKKSIYDKKENI